MLLLFVVETKESNDSDKMYINKYLTTRYPQVTPGANISVQWVYMNGKTNYKNGSVCKKITDKIAGYKRYPQHDDRIHVAYCIDIDSGAESKKLNKEIEEYCKDNEYHLIWFNKTVEQVFLGKLIHQSKNKKNEAISFLKREMSKEGFCDERYCLRELYESRLRTSNIGYVLESIFAHC